LKIFILKEFQHHVVFFHCVLIIEQRPEVCQDKGRIAPAGKKPI